MKTSISLRQYRKLQALKEQADSLNLQIDQLIRQANLITGEKIDDSNDGNDFICNQAVEDLAGILQRAGIAVGR